MDARGNDCVKIRFEARVVSRGSTEGLVVVSDISPTGLNVSLPFPVKDGELVELEMADSLVLARISDAVREDDSYRAHLTIENVRLGTSSLSQLLERTLHDVAPETAGLVPASVLLD